MADQASLRADCDDVPAELRKGVRVLVGDCRDVLRVLPDESVNCIVTSPPYFGLRDYGVDGQIGLEATPDAFVAELVSVFREVRRVLRKDGTLWLNLGDSYVSSPPGNKLGSKDGDGLYRRKLDLQENLSPTMRAGGHAGSHANAGVMSAIAYRTTGNDGVYETGDAVGALTTSSDPNAQVVAYAIQERAICENPNAGPDGAGIREDLSYTLEARSTPQAVAFNTPNGGRAGMGVGAIATRWAVRRLTPNECESLQGFPRDYTLVPVGKRMSADGPRYKQLGNSKAVNVVRWIGQRIQAVEDFYAALAAEQAA